MMEGRAAPAVDLTAPAETVQLAEPQASQTTTIESPPVQSVQSSPVETKIAQ